MDLFSSLLGQKMGGGEAVVNGKIKNCIVADETTIKPGDFVSYAKLFKYTPIDSLYSANFGNWATTKAIALSSNKFFVTFQKDSNDHGISARVITCNGSVLEKGLVYRLSDDFYSYIIYALFNLNENEIVIIHQGASYKLKATICVINGSQITVKKTEDLDATVGSGISCAAVQLQDNSIFTIHTSDNSSYLLNWDKYAYNGESMIKLTGGSVITTTKCGYNLSIAKLTENKFLIGYVNRAATRTNTLYCRILTFENGVKSVGTTKQIINYTNSVYAYPLRLLTLTDSRVLATYSPDGGGGKSHTCKIIQVDGTDISTLYVSTGFSFGADFKPINSNSFVSTNTSATDTYKNASFSYVAIFGTTLQKGSVTVANELASYSPCTIRLSDNKYVGVFRTADNVYATIITPVVVKDTLKSSGKTFGDILGIAKTGGTSGDQIEVYVPNFN